MSRAPGDTQEPPNHQSHLPEDVDPPAYPAYQGPAGETPNEPRINHNPQRRYIAICAFFVEQAHAEGRDIEFWNQCQARYFLQWPLHHTRNMGPYLNQVKADILNDLEIAAAIPSCLQVEPFMHWECMFALSGIQFDEAGAQMLSEQSQIEYESALARLQASTPTQPVQLAPAAGPSSAPHQPSDELPSAGKKKAIFIDLTMPSPVKVSGRGKVGSRTTSASSARGTRKTGVIDLTSIDEEV